MSHASFASADFTDRSTATPSVLKEKTPQKTKNYLKKKYWKKPQEDARWAWVQRRQLCFSRDLFFLHHRVLTCIYSCNNELHWYLEVFLSPCNDFHCRIMSVFKCSVTSQPEDHSYSIFFTFLICITNKWTKRLSIIRDACRFAFLKRLHNIQSHNHQNWTIHSENYMCKL